MRFLVVVIAIRHSGPTLPRDGRHRRRRRRLPTPVTSSPILGILLIVRLARRRVRMRTRLCRPPLAGRSDALDRHRGRVGARDGRASRVPSGFRTVADESGGGRGDASLGGGGGGGALSVALGALPLAITVAGLAGGAVVTTRVVAGLVGGCEEVGA